METRRDRSPDSVPDSPARGGLATGIATIQSYLATLPGSPGVYRMLGAKGEALYVGKARNLRKRVANYANPNRLPVRLQRMVAKTNDAGRLGLFREEAAGLEALARTKTVLVPEPLVVTAGSSVAVLLMTAMTGPTLTITWAPRPSPTGGTTTGSGSTPSAAWVTS
jgi:hypothetical protein